MNYKQQIYYNILWLQILLDEDEGEEEDENLNEKEDNTVLQIVLI